MTLLHLLCAVVAVIANPAVAQTYHEPDMVDQLPTGNYVGPAVTSGWGQNFIATAFLGGQSDVYATVDPSDAQNGLLPAPANTDSYGQSGLLRADLRRNTNPSNRPNTFRWFLVAASSQNLVYTISQIGQVPVTQQVNGEPVEVISYNNKIAFYQAGTFGDGRRRPTNSPFGAKMARGSRVDSCNAELIYISSSAGRSSQGHVSIFSYNTETPREEVGGFAFESFVTAGNAAGYGSDIASSGNRLAVAAPGEGNGAVYVYSIAESGCVFSGTQESKLASSGGTPALFGHSINWADSNTLVVGSPSETGANGLPSTGVTYIYKGAPLSEFQRVYPTAEEFPEVTDGLEMGFAVSGRQSAWIMAGAPGAYNNGGAGYFIRLNATSGSFFIEHRTSRVGDLGVAAANQREGETVVGDGCAAFLLGAPGVDAIYTTQYDISAFFPDEYCSCATISLQQFWPRYRETIDGQEVCEKVEKNTYLQCQAGGAPRLCNYKNQVGYRFVSPELGVGLDTFGCFKPTDGRVRKNWKPNCFYPYDSVGEKA